MMRGHLGQLVMVNRKDNLIIVRLGHNRIKQDHIGQYREDIFTYIDEAYNMLHHD